MGQPQYKSFDRISAQIALLPSRSLREASARALLASTELDHSRTPPRPASPDTIEDHYGISKETLVEMQICLTKSSALEFMRRSGLREISGPSFKKQLSKKSYMKMFARQPSMLGSKVLVFTYAELQHFLGVAFPLDLPESLHKMASSRGDS